MLSPLQVRHILTEKQCARSRALLDNAYGRTATALDAITRLKAGEAFNKVAGELSIDKARSGGSCSLQFAESAHPL
jgi:hypothetical protein